MSSDFPSEPDFSDEPAEPPASLVSMPSMSEGSRRSRDGRGSWSGRGGRTNGRGDDQNYDDFRQPPHDIDAEQGVLGAMLLSPTLVVDIIETLVPDDFYRPAHQLIYNAIIDLFSNNKEIDPLIVAGRLDRDNNLERIGGSTYLHTLVSAVPTAANARYYAEIVAEKAVLRRLVAAGTRVVQLGYEGTEGAELETVIDMAQQQVFDIAQRHHVEDYSVLADLIQPTMDELDLISVQGGLARGIPTGFEDLDNLTNGLHGGQMIIVAARPGVGKSTLALDFVRSCAIKNGKAAVIFSLEMAKSEIVMRILSAEADVKLSDMRSGRMTDQDWAKLVNRLDTIEHSPIYIDDSASLTMMEIRSKSRKSRQQEVAEFSRQLKLLAKELDVPLVAISQLNRGPESRTDKRPQIADLRESGSLEQDADIVMLLYRPDSQDKDDTRAGEADIIVAKHRGGPIDTVQVAHQLHFSRFKDMARQL